MSLCLAAGGKTAALAISLFTLSWTHSVEKIEWQEDWRVEGDRLELVEARVKGSGAGMEPPDGAVFDGGWWRYHQDLSVPELVLARSGATETEWQLCYEASCRDLETVAGAGREPVRLTACPR